MLGVRGCAARQCVLFENICSLRIYFFANFSCLCSPQVCFSTSVNYVFPHSVISRFFDRILCSLRVRVRAAQLLQLRDTENRGEILVSHQNSVMCGCFEYFLRTFFAIWAKFSLLQISRTLWRHSDIIQYIFHLNLSNKGIKFNSIIKNE